MPYSAETKPWIGHHLEIISCNPRRLFNEYAYRTWERAHAYENLGNFVDAVKDLIGFVHLAPEQNKSLPDNFKLPDYMIEMANTRIKKLAFEGVTDSNSRNEVLRYIKRREHEARKLNKNAPHLNDVRQLLGFPIINDLGPFNGELREAA